MPRRSGKIVQTSDGKIGNTYYDERPINGKLTVHIIANSLHDLTEGIFLNEPYEKRLCRASSLRFIGYTD